jgi:hypothetical protein
VQSDGLSGYWEWRLEDLEARQRSDRGAPVSNVELAEAHAGLGHRDQALDYLERGDRQNDPRLRGVRADPVWDPFRRDPRFMRVLDDDDDDEDRGPSGSGRGDQGRGDDESRDNQGRRGQGPGNSGRRGDGPGGRPQGSPPPAGG